MGIANERIRLQDEARRVRTGNDLRKFLAQIVGATMTDDSGNECQVEAPCGYTWDGELHSFVVTWGKSGFRKGPQFDNGPKAWAMRDVAERVANAYPFEACKADCDCKA